MARISFSEAGKKLEEAVHFAFGNESFDLDKDGTHETDDATVISSANAHPYLVVEPEVAADEETAEEKAAKVAESDDPHLNPRADHLSAEADPEVVKAAQERNEAVQAEVQSNEPQQQAKDAESTVPQPVETQSTTPAQSPSATARDTSSTGTTTSERAN